jgi:hypothetical protein
MGVSDFAVVDAMLMIRPQPDRIMPGRKVLQQLYVPVRFTREHHPKHHLTISRKLAAGAMPALLIKICTVQPARRSWRQAHDLFLSATRSAAATLARQPQLLRQCLKLVLVAREIINTRRRGQTLQRSLLQYLR